MRAWWPLSIALLGAVFLAWIATTPPAPRNLETPRTAFSAARAMADVREISRAPHPTGSADNAWVRAWLVGRLTDLGMTVRTRAAPMGAEGAADLRKWSGDPTPRPVVDIVATLPGRDRAAPAAMLMAHHDSVWGSPAAADDGAGIASALETVRAIRAEGQPARDLIVVFTDGEELGLDGGKAFFAGDPDRGRVGAIVNLEARGGGGRTAMFETGHDNGAMMDLFDRAVRRPSATSLSVFIYEHLPNSTDFTPAKKLGYAGFNFAFIGRPALYHSPLATADALDQGALQDMGDQTLDLVRALLNVPTLPGKAANLVFFDAFGWFMIAYPPVVGWLVIAAATGLYALAAWRTRAKLGDIGRGVVATLTLTVGGGGLLFLGNLLSGADGKTNYYDRLAAIPRLEVQALLLALAAFVSVVALFRRRGETEAVVVGLAAPLLLLGLAVQARAPTAAFIVAWPLLLGGLSTTIRSLAGRTAGRIATIATIVTAALGVGYLVGMTFSLLEAVGPDLPSAAALPLALIGALAWPLVPPLRRRDALVSVAILLLAACVIALWVRFDPIAPSVPPYSLHR